MSAPLPLPPESVDESPPSPPAGVKFNTLKNIMNITSLYTSPFQCGVSLWFSGWFLCCFSIYWIDSLFLRFPQCRRRYNRYSRHRRRNTRLRRRCYGSMSVEQNSLNNENLSFPIEQKVNWTKVIWTFSYSIMKSFEQKDNCPAWKFINSQFISCKLNNSQLNNFLFEQINIKQVQKSIDKCVNWTITNWTVHTIEQKASWYFFCSIDLLSIDMGIIH